jgi:ammonium transporter Rh
MLSTLGFSRLQAMLLTHMQLHDTCGIHNLHGMPSVLGALVSVLLPALFPGMVGIGSPAVQMMGILSTLVVAVSTGVLTALMMKPFGDRASSFDDSEYWEVAEETLFTAAKAELVEA